jgi:hypothetical protein
VIDACDKIADILYFTRVHCQKNYGIHSRVKVHLTSINSKKKILQNPFFKSAILYVCYYMVREKIGL